jgi:hypothetical protein
MPADGALKPLTVDVVARNPEAFVKSYNSLLDAVAADKIEIKKGAEELARLDADLKLIKQERALAALDRPEYGSEVEMRQFLGDDGKLLLRGVEGRGDDQPAWTPGLLDSKPTCEWQRRLQDLCEMRTIAGLRPGNGSNRVGTPRIDKMIQRHLKVAPAPIKRAIDDGKLVERLFSGSSGSGSEWEQTLVLPRVEETMKVLAGAANFFEVVEMGSKTLDLPFMTTGLRPYIKGTPTVDNPAYYTGSSIDTTKRSFTATGMAVMSQILDDASEDSIIDTMSFLREQLAQGILDGEEDAIMNGDTAATHQDTIASWDIRSRWGSSGLGGASDHRRAWIGLRARAMDIGSDAKLDGSSYTAFSGSTGLLAAAEIKLHFGSMNGPTVYFTSPEHFLKIIKSDSNLLTLEKYGPQATIFTGEVGKVGLTRIHRTQYLSADMNTSGIYDNNTKTKTASLLVDPRRFKIFRRRGLALETQKEIRNGVTYMVLTVRETFGTVDASGTVNVVNSYNLAKS